MHIWNTVRNMLDKTKIYDEYDDFALLLLSCLPIISIVINIIIM